jgi:3-deoxy-D-manno-octulosonate 8-phosphate phosphatase (KDO 8-P phosphatase)
LPTIRYAGFGIAVANAVDEVKKYSDYITTRPGGSGAVREVIEYILKNSDRWQQLMTRYLP